ncbi:LPXTG cell wall anchor domain-containing protein [Gemella cuniculi]|uniref:LPXTG cell wall anchor domain-containing protein n=1 Tax=Gemella cuniculi TaxID=150240 RepID=UPI00040875D7|nr:LPXTG cell wall anchor domain-containing protein [Gemella cuniculi]
MKKNNLLKILSAAAIVSTLSVIETGATAQNNSTYAANEIASKIVEVPATLMHAYEPGRKSMGNAALSKVTVQKIGAQYKYTVIWKELSFLGQKDGVSKFWVEGSEVTLKPISGEGNPKMAEFTLSELKSTIKVEVFVQTMENIMPGGGRQPAILQLDTTVAKAEFDKPAEKPKNENPVKPGNSEKPKNEDSTKPGNSEKPKNENQTNPTKPGSQVQPSTPGTGHDSNTGKPQNDNGQTQQTASTVTYFDGVTAQLMHANQPGRKSMGDAALNGVTIYKQGDTYHYVVYFKDIKVGTLTDGIKRFWVNGVEYPVVPTGGANNQVRVHFTSKQKLTQVPVSVFVQVMENIMPGGGKQNAILTFNWNNAKERQGVAPSGLNSNPRQLPNTGLDTSSTIFAGTITLLGAALLGRRKQK